MVEEKDMVRGERYQEGREEMIGLPWLKSRFCFNVAFDIVVWCHMLHVMFRHMIIF